jgi:hypothetical protein
MAKKKLKFSLNKAVHNGGWYKNLTNQISALESQVVTLESQVTTLENAVIAEQPVSQIADLADANLEAVWLNRLLQGNGNDLTSNNNDLSPVGTVPFDASIGAGPFSLSNYLEMTAAAFSGNGDSLGSISGWFKRSTVDGGRHMMFASSDTVLDSNEWLFSIDNNLLAVQTDGTNITRGTTDLSALEEWIHVAITSDGARWLMYLNGVPETLNTTNGSNDGSWLADVAGRLNITLGVWHRSSSISSTASAFLGQLRDWRYYSREITQAEITSQCLWIPQH